eukprot:TRINITY_DN2490_c0_g1_i1.p1 TRINITY_DN2490_c0_g1~~TRINITY_DN2490_c0_g1_i1.p1  ORF type:complete len:625 (+),score=180.59 TRINITY_DN2490_c0_g1_i1:167-2041(+)
MNNLKSGTKLIRFISQSNAIAQRQFSVRAFRSIPSNGIFIQKRFAHTNLGMPALSPTMTQGNIAKWRKKEGDKIKPGDILADIETDKATMEFEATEEGYLAKILAENGSRDIPINKPIAITVDSESEIAEFKDYKPDSQPAAKPTPPPSNNTQAQAPPKKEQSTPQNNTPPQPQQTQSKPSKNYPTHNSLKMPALSPTMTQGNIVKWRKKEGDQIKPGDILADIETDKATMEFEATEDGYLAKILAQSGSRDISVNTPIAILVDSKDDAGKFGDYSEDSAASTPKPQKAPEGEAPSAPSTPSKQETTQTSAPSSTTSPQGRIFASPLAKKIAKETGVDINQVKGTGPSNRIISDDVKSFQKVQPQKTAEKVTEKAPAQEQPVSAVPSSISSFDDVPLSQIRRVIAQRLTLSKQTIPHYYLTMECRVDELLKVRAQLNKMGEGKNGYKISVGDFVTKAAALALRKVPAVNTSWNDQTIRQYKTVDINIAVTTERGLFTPLIRDADLKGLVAISSQTKDYADRAKAGKLQPHEFASGTFTISNLGMFGIKHFSAVINPPQSAILAVGTSEKRVIPKENSEKEGDYEVANIMTVTLSCDHRTIDGSVGAEWLQAFKDYIENPLKLML